MEKPVSVYLARDPETSEKEEFEPQRVRVISNNIGLLQIESKYRLSGQYFNFNVGFNNYTKGIRRIALSFVQYFNTIPNVNANNNRFTYFDNGDATFKSGFLTIGWYDLAGLATNLQNALNASIPPPVAPFTVVANAGSQTLTTSNANTFYFDPTSDFITRGQNLHGYPPSTNLVNIFESGISKLFYTTYFIIESEELTRYTKNISTSNNALLSNIVGLVTLQNPTVPGARNEAIYNEKQWQHFFAATQITNINIRIVDEYGLDPDLITLGDPSFSIEINTQL
jgi:hypothetical protein